MNLNKEIVEFCE
ncbi:hypothetical protein ZEAMMB73_Zm00001d000082 [Zea mays]|nr:hypothetical protein ZEAMMB73_Zm00001d000082 [Zea mays]